MVSLWWFTQPDSPPSILPVPWNHEKKGEVPVGQGSGHWDSCDNKPHSSESTVPWFLSHLTLVTNQSFPHCLTVSSMTGPFHQNSTCISSFSRNNPLSQFPGDSRSQLTWGQGHFLSPFSSHDFVFCLQRDRPHAFAPEKNPNQPTKRGIWEDLLCLLRVRSHQTRLWWIPQSLNQ
jgi:hypothetical protein